MSSTYEMEQDRFERDNLIDQLRARNEELEAEVAHLKGDPDSYDNTYKRNLEHQRENSRLREEIARLRKALEATREYLMGGKWIYEKSPDEFIKAALEASNG